MKKTILFSFIILNLSVYAQLNNRFWGTGNATMVQNIGFYANNIFIGWRDVQKFPWSPYAWENVDSLVQANQLAGLRTMITLKCTNPINSNDSIPGTSAWCYNQNLTTDNASAWFPDGTMGTDTTLWKTFVDAIVERYDGDGQGIEPTWLDAAFRVSRWHVIGQEWQRIWSSNLFLDTTCNAQSQDTSLASTQKFVQLVNMTYDVIKNQQPGTNSEVSFAGIDTRHKAEAFYDGYFTDITFCISQACDTQFNPTAPQLALTPNFLQTRRNTMYILKNSKFDEVDVHAYGRWSDIPGVVNWLKDSAQNKEVIFMEGGGPNCKACEDIYHSLNDTDGRLPAPLLKDNASYVVYYFVTGFASGVKKMNWHIGPEYTNWGAVFGDLDLMSINWVSKPSYYVCRWLAKTIFSNTLADTVIRITESNPNLYHYRVQSLAADTVIEVAWSTNIVDSIVVNGTGDLYTWNIPTTCDSLGFPSMYPTECDSIFPMNTYSVSGSHTIALNDGVPVFYNWNNVIGIDNLSTTENISIKIYPNPFSETTTVRIMNGQIADYELKVYNLFGQEIQSEHIYNSDSFVIQRGYLPGGTYFYQVKNEQYIIGIGKIIIQ